MVVISSLMLYLLVTGKKIRKYCEKWSEKAGKKISKRKLLQKEKNDEENLENGVKKEEDQDKHSIKIPDENTNTNEKTPTTKSDKQASKPETFSSKFKRHLISNLKHYDGFILIFIVCLLTAVQIILIHIFKLSVKQSLISNFYRRNDTIIHKVCVKLQREYLFEELIYAPFVMIILFTILFTHRSSRFSMYILNKYKNFFCTNIYKSFLKKQEEHRSEIIKKKLGKMTKCQRCCYNTKNSCICQFLCCIFCCTCCDLTKKDEKSKKEGCCGPCYCCCQPLLQTDCCKVLCMTKKILRCILCIDLWCCIRGCIMDKRKRDKEKEEKEKEKSEDLEESQELIRRQFKWPIPLLPYSTRNRLVSTAVYVAYTYDIVNIFIYLNSSFIAIPLTPILSEKNGVLKDFFIQILQVLVIGFKFYPILAVADIEPQILTYLLSFIFVFVMWVVKMFKKALCSGTDAFVKFSIDQVEKQIHNTKVFRWNDRLNLTNRIDLNQLDETEESKYKKIRDEKIPQFFDKFFGRKLDNQGITTTPSYMPTMFPQVMNLTSSRSGFRKKIANKTLGFVTDILDGLSEQEDTQWTTTLRNLLENLPLYICLSYLLARFLLSLIQILIKKCEPCVGKCSKGLLSDKNDQSSYECLKKAILSLSQTKTSPNSEYHIIDNYAQFGISKYRTENYNYAYVKMHIISKIPLYCDRPRGDENKDNRYISFTLNLLYKIYEPVRHFKFSKQLINTYVVAFMLIYFLTVFILRASSTFGAWLVRSLQVIFQLLFGTILPSFSFQDHNLIVEFAAACLITSLICFIQLLLSIESFQKYVLALHRGGQLSNTTIDPNVDSRDLFMNLFKEKRKPCDKESKKVNISEMMASHSLHYPGYLVAHLVYAYFLMFIGLFIFILVVKLVYYIPQVFQFTLQIFLPVMILLLLRILLIKFLTRTAFSKNDSNFISNLTPYFFTSYFNFFFDCFLGFVACMNRVWQTTIVSVLYLPRLDKTMFNEKESLLLQQLDKGHLAYMNFVHMEHLYNNPVLISFTEILIEMMFISQIRKHNLKKHVHDKVLKVSVKSSENVTSVEKESKKFSMGEHTASVLKQPVKEDVSRSISYLLENSEEQEDLILSQIYEQQENSESEVISYESEKRQQFEKNLSLIINQQPSRSEHMCIDENEIKPRSKLERQATVVSINGEDVIKERLVEMQSNQSQTSPKKSSKEIEADKQGNRFKYTSYRKLCNLFYLFVLLKKNNELCKYTAFNIKNERPKCKNRAPRVESFFQNVSRVLTSSGSESGSDSSIKEKKPSPKESRRLSRVERDDSEEERKKIYGTEILDSDDIEI